MLAFDDSLSDFRRLASLLRLCADTLTTMLERRDEGAGQMAAAEQLPAELRRIADRVEAFAASHLL